MKPVTGHVRDSGGGVFTVVVDRDTDNYPWPGRGAWIEQDDLELLEAIRPFFRLLNDRVGRLSDAVYGRED